MKKNQTMILAIVIGAIAVIAGAIVYANLTAPDRPGSNADNMRIETVSNLKGDANQLISGSVYTAQSENFYVDPSKGQVSEVNVSQGSSVSKGTALYKYSNPTLSTTYEKATIQLSSAKKRKKALDTDLANLNKDIKNAPSTEIKKQLETQRDQTKTQLDGVNDEIKIANLDIGDLENQIAKLTVRSNFDGIVEMVNEDEKNAIGQGAASKPLIRVVSNLPYEIKGTLSELQRSQIKSGQGFTATSKALPGQSWAGSVTYVSTFPTASGTAQGQENYANVQYEYIAKLDSQDNLVPGNTVYLEINAVGGDSFFIPSEALKKDGQETYLFTVQDGKLKKQSVMTGEEKDGRTAINSPISDETEILLNPGETAADGMDVKR